MFSPTPRGRDPNEGREGKPMKDLTFGLTLVVCLMMAAGCAARAPQPGNSFEAPEQAMEFHVRQRLPLDATQIPLDHLHAELEKLKVREERQRAVEQATATWRSLGPGNIGGRTRALAIDSNNPDVMYAAGVAGGIWKSTDAGANWQSLDDMMLNLAVCTIAIDPTNSDILYAGTGEGYGNSVFVRGLGVFKSVDAGSSWTQLSGTVNGVPWGAFHYVNKIVISPNDANRIYAATRTGVWRSLDAGATWSPVLSNPSYLSTTPASNGSTVGATDIAIRTDSNPDILFAAFGSGQADGLFRSLDGGDSWEVYAMPTNQGRMTIALAPSNNDVIYLLMADNGSGNAYGQLVDVFRSEDGGDTFTGQVDFAGPTGPWLLSNLGLALGCRPGSTYSQGWYDNVIAVDPVDPDTVWVGGIDLFRSDDRGQNFQIAAYWQFYTLDPAPPYYVHPDQHTLVFHPDYDGVTNQTLYAGNDGGLFRTTNARAATGEENCPLTPDEPFPAIAWESMNHSYAVTQFYHGDSARADALFVGGAQDNGTNRLLPRQSLNEWRLVFGGDGGYVAIDPRESRTFYIEYHSFPTIYKTVDAGETFVPADGGITDTDGIFITPFAMDPSNPDVLWTGGSRPWRTMDGATSWQLAGADFPIADKISAIGIAPSDGNVVYLGFTNGLVALTRNSLDPEPTWKVFSAGLVSGAWVSSIAVDPIDPDIAYVTYSNYGVEHVHHTLNGGQSWNSLDGIDYDGVPDIPVHWISVRSCRPQELYVGTELGIFASDDSGTTWQPFNDGLAHTVVESLDFKTSNELVAFSHGRGVFMTDLAPCSLPAPGSLPDGAAVSGSLLAVSKSGVEITLEWNASCSIGGDDYAVYGGTIGDFTSHAPLVCSTAGARTLTFTPESEGRYFLVVPRNAEAEGLYGTDGAGWQRSQGSPACAVQEAGACP